MRIKNTGSSIVSVGKVIILPDETVEITDEGYANNSALQFLIQMKRLKEINVPSKKIIAEPTENEDEAEEAAEVGENPSVKVGKTANKAYRRKNK